MTGRTLFDRIWHAHVVVPETDDTPAVLYIDGHLIHEVTSPQAFTVLRERGLPVRRPDRTLATADHATPTEPRDAANRWTFTDPMARTMVSQLVANCTEHGIRCELPDGGRQGIVHVIGPELGFTQPGMTIVCGDSHTSTHGAFGALAFGIGSTEVGHVLATQCLLQRRPQTMRVTFTGRLADGVTAKDMALAMIAEIGVHGATGHVIEYAGPAVEALDMEGRMTLCNLSIEAGARAGLVAPDDVTFAWLESRPLAPFGEARERAVARWRELRSDDDAVFDREVTIDASALQPMITWGTTPAMAIPVTGAVPEADARSAGADAQAYVGVQPGPIAGHPIDVVFIGSCTNSRLSDLTAAAKVLAGRRVADGVRTLVVPGSQAVKRAAESLRLHEVFIDAGCEWREPGCSMCIAMNGDALQPGQTAISTSNRNFEGRQGRGGRTLLASPLTAAASAVRGCVTDPRELPADPVLASTSSHTH